MIRLTIQCVNYVGKWMESVDAKPVQNLLKIGFKILGKISISVVHRNKFPNVFHKPRFHSVLMRAKCSLNYPNRLHEIFVALLPPNVISNTSWTNLVQLVFNMGATCTSFSVPHWLWKRLVTCINIQCNASASKLWAQIISSFFAQVRNTWSKFKAFFNNEVWNPSFFVWMNVVSERMQVSKSINVSSKHVYTLLWS